MIKLKSNESMLHKHQWEDYFLEKPSQWVFVVIMVVCRKEAIGPSRLLP